MSNSQTTAQNDLIGNLNAFERQLTKATHDAGFGRRLASYPMNIELNGDSPTGPATLNFTFVAGHGMDHRLTTMIDSETIATAEGRQALADTFVLYLQRATARAPAAAGSRRAITAAAATVIAEAGAEGIELELLRLEPAPIHVFGKPRIEDETPQVFYVHFVMPHVEKGVLTRDSYTVDADDAEEFADYLRKRTLPELRNVIRAHVAGLAA